MNTIETRLTDETYWNEGYKDAVFGEATSGGLVDLLNKYLDNVENKSCIEIGSFPGAYLPVIGKKGYILNGIDFNPRNEKDLPEWLSGMGLKTGKFWAGDFFEFIKEEKTTYDLVCSFGFIEHFENYLEVIAAHLKLLKPGGKIIITTPNFRGWMQYLPHKLFDNENLGKHNLKSMNPVAWKMLMEQNGLEVQFSGYFGKYNFWVDTAKHRSGLSKLLLKSTNRIIYNLNKLIKRSGKDAKAYSAFCGIVAVKK